MMIERFWMRLSEEISLSSHGWLRDPDTSWFGSSSALLTSDEIRQARCLVCLGGPGMGKSTVLAELDGLVPDGVGASVIRFDLGEFSTESMLWRQVFEHPSVLQWQSGSEVLVLVLDSLDEALVRVPTLWRRFGRWLAEVDTRRLILRVACRTAGWPAALSQKLTERYDDAEFVELLPLRRRDAMAYLSQAGADADGLLSSIERAGAGPLAARPITLRLLTAARREGERPLRGVDIYRQGCLALIEEQNPERRDSGLSGPAPVAVFHAAGQLAACSVLAGIPTFWTGPTTQRDDADLAIDECFAPADSGSFAAATAALHSGLFAGAGEQRLKWSHATFADYLAASWVMRAGLTDDQIRALCVTTGERIFTPVRQLAAWLVALEPARFGWLVESDAAAFLNNIDLPSESLRAEVVARVAEDLARGRLYDDWSWDLAGLSHPGLADQLRDLLGSSREEVVDFGVRLARACSVTDASARLVRIVLDPDASRAVRTSAALGLRDLGARDDRTAIVSLLRDDSLHQLEDGAELWAAIARAVWPGVVSTSGLLRVVAPRPRPTLVGVYSIFVHELASSVARDDLPAAREWFERRMAAIPNELESHRDRDRDLVAAIVRLSVENLDSADAQAVIALRAEIRSRSFHAVFGSSAPIGNLEEGARRQIAVIVASNQGTDTGDALAWSLVTHDRGLDGTVLGQDDFAWVLDQIDSQPTETAAVFERVADLLFRDTLVSHVDLVLTRPASSRSSRYFEPRTRVVDLASEVAEIARQGWEARRDLERRWSARRKPRGKRIPARIKSFMEAAASGDAAAYWQASRLMTVPPETNRYSDMLEPDLTKHPRWDSLPVEVRDRFVELSDWYVRVGQSDAPTWFGKGRCHYPSVAAYRALTLLLRLAPDRLEAIPDEVWREWAPILVAWPTATNAASDLDKGSLLARALPGARGELQDSVLAMLDMAIANDDYPFLRTEMTTLHDQWLAEQVVDRVRAASHHEKLSDVIDYLVTLSPDLALSLLDGWVADDAIDQHPDRARSAALRLLRRFGERSWARLSELMAHRADFMREVFLSSQLGHDRELPDVSESALGDLWLFLEDGFPSAADPIFDDVHFVGPRETVGRFRDDIIRRLRATPSAAAVETIQRLIGVHPGEPSLRFALLTVQRQYADSAWRPLRPESVLALAGSAMPSFVLNQRDLWHRVQSALDIIQMDLQTDTPTATQLWNTDSRRPKHEDELSDFLVTELRRLMSTAGIVASREVPSRRRAESGLADRPDLRVEAPLVGVDSRQRAVVPIEVKGVWHSEVMTALRTQLVDRYMLDLGVTHGVYVVFWFDVESWDPSDRRRERAQRFDSIEDLREALAVEAAQSSAASDIAIVALDASLRWGLPRAVERKSALGSEAASARTPQTGAGGV